MFNSNWNQYKTISLLIGNPNVVFFIRPCLYMGKCILKQLYKNHAMSHRFMAAYC